MQPRKRMNEMSEMFLPRTAPAKPSQAFKAYAE
jgi:hypothetical protein